MNGNGKTETEVRTKKCPFLKEWCIGEACALATVLTRRMGTRVEQTTVCAFVALVTMISEINSKTQPPLPQKMQLPNLIRG